MIEKFVKRAEGETPEEYLIRLGNLKESGVLLMTWPQLAEILNSNTPEVSKPMNESSWRKRYRRLSYNSESNENRVATYEAPVNNVEEEKKKSEASQYTNVTNKVVDEKTLTNEKVKVQVRDERMALNRRIRNDARFDTLLNIFREEIKRAAPVQKKARAVRNTHKAVYALLSDIHYGISYNSSAGKYNSDIAKDRVLRYAEEIADIGELHNADCCYVSLLGDMISGNIHSAIRVENKENVVQQVIGVAELVASFLYDLCGKFSEVHVNSVSGNHSRLDLNADDALRGDKLDELIPWYCKTKLSDCNNIIWHDNDIDTTIANFNIFGINYVSVHGDFDNNLQKSAMVIERLTHDPIDYILAGHMHVPELRLDTLGVIRNGSVCGSGDEFTMKKRLFGFPYQICLIVDETGVRDYIPVQL